MLWVCITGVVREPVSSFILDPPTLFSAVQIVLLKLSLSCFRSPRPESVFALKTRREPPLESGARMSGHQQHVRLNFDKGWFNLADSVEGRGVVDGRLEDSMGYSDQMEERKLR